MVMPSGLTSAKPPRTWKTRVLPSMRMTTSPSVRVVMNGAWSTSTPNSPSVPGAVTWSTSPANSSRSGVTSETWSLPDILLAFRLQLFGLGDGVLDGADHVEGGFRQVVVLAVADALEALDGVFDRHQHARRAGEHFGDVEGLRHE